jgi:hypothetical protein
MTFSDPLGDAEAGIAPDIGAVAGLVGTACQIGVDPQVQYQGVDIPPDGLIDGDAVFVFIDTDGNIATGDPAEFGADRVVGTLGRTGVDGLPLVGTWDPTTQQMNFVGGATLTPVDTAGFTTSLDTLAVTAPGTAHISVGTIWTSSITGNSYVDFAPDVGGSAPTLGIAFGPPAATPTPTVTPTPAPVTPTPATPAPGGGSTVSGSSDDTFSCKVPRTKGLRLFNAEDKLTEAGCDWGKVTRVYSSTIPKGRIVRTSPPAGAHTTRPVALVVSKGRRSRHLHARAARLQDAVALGRLAAMVSGGR